MSTYEYIDLCEKAQNLKSKYHVFTFDIVDSKRMSKEDRIEASYKIEKLMLLMYKELELREKIENKKILLKKDIVPYEERLKVDKKFGVLYEPFFFANTFGFTVYTNSISEDDIYELFEKYKNILGITYMFHFNNLYYETNDYGLGGKCFFRGYAIDICSNLHKPIYSKIKVKK